MTFYEYIILSELDNPEQTRDFNTSENDSSTTMKRSSTMNDNCTLDDTSKWINDADDEILMQENVTFIQNKIENNETNKQNQWLKKKLNETLLNKTPEKSCIKQQIGIDKNFDMSDILKIVNEVVDKKLKVCLMNNIEHFVFSCSNLIYYVILKGH